MSLLMSAIITYSIGNGSLGQCKVQQANHTDTGSRYKETQSETKQQARKVQLHRDKNRAGKTDMVVELPSLHNFNLQRYWDDLVYAATPKIKTNEWTTRENPPPFTSLVLRAFDKGCYANFMHWREEPPLSFQKPPPHLSATWLVAINVLFRPQLRVLHWDLNKQLTVYPEKKWVKCWTSKMLRFLLFSEERVWFINWQNCKCPLKLFYAL